jgi:puromycin-sensitive aminopeptidase
MSTPREESIRNHSGRLPKAVLPRAYHLNLKVIPKDKQFSGHETIDVCIVHPVQAITLHALEITLGRVQVHQGNLILPATVSFDSSNETVTLALSKPLETGTAQIDILYSGTLNKQLRGLYEAPYEGEMYAFTQFEATDARRMLPCFDEPGMKACFSLTVTYPHPLTALSNMPALKETTDGDLKTTQFATTPIMSTYLLALALAPLESKTIQVGATTVTVWALPKQLPLSDFALKVTRAVLPRLNDYFGLPYPYPKLDLVAAPNFAMGAMENWGAIFFRDSCLLLDENLSSTTTQRDVANVITHEIVHQWFGNLVTMKWWDDLWLNESFATWLACKIVDQWIPEWNSWLEFQQEKEIPLAIDALDHTRPIQSEVQNAAQIEELFDALTYEKGAACLRMLETFLGEDLFREGIRRYIKKFQYQNAAAEDLWDELSDASGQPVGTIARDWFTHPGFPRVTVYRDPNNRQALIFRQQRFRTSPKRGDEWETRVIPFTFKYQNADGLHHDRILLKGPVTVVQLQKPVTAVYGNADEAGFLRVDYDPSLRANLESALPSILNPTERIGYLGHLWGLSLSGEEPIDSFLNTLRYFKGDGTRVVVEAVVQYLETLANQMVQPEDLSVFQSFSSEMVGPIFRALGWEREDGKKDEEASLTRATALWGLGRLAEDEDILAELPRRKTRYWAIPTSLDPTLATPLMRLCARFDGGSLFEPFVQKYETAATPEERDRYLLALADFNKPTLAVRLLEMSLTDTIRSQDAWKPVRYLLRNPVVQETTWEFIKAHWKALREKAGSVGATRMIQSTRALCRPDWKGEVESFFNLPENRVDAAERALLQTIEFIGIGIRFRRQADRLSVWLNRR